MNYKRILAGAFVSAMLMSATVSADYETDYNQYDTTSQTNTLATENYDDYADSQTTTEQTWETMTSTTTTEYVEPLKPAEEPAKVELNVGEVSDGTFKAKLNIDSVSAISNANITISYDETQLELSKTSFNEEAGGMPVENKFAGKYVYNYTNSYGTDFDGAFATLKFKIIDDTMTSAILYVTVTSLDDTNAAQISYKATNGIVTNIPDEEYDANLVVLNLDLTGKYIKASKLGLKNVDRVTVEDKSIVKFLRGKFKGLAAGKTKIIVEYKDGTAESFVIKVTDPNAAEAGAEITDSADSSKAAAPIEAKKPESHTVRNIIIFALVFIALAIIVAEYFIIVKPFDRKKHAKKNRKPNLYKEDEEVDTVDAEALEKAIKKSHELRAKQAEGGIPLDDSSDESDLSSTQQINKALIARGFIMTDDVEDE